ncbi:uncharacterized protein LOC142356806 isoform X2 [Convolutriloba macropyga]
MFGRPCRAHSQYYCLDAYLTPHPHPGRRFERGDFTNRELLEPAATKAWFQVLILKNWRRINMIDPRNPKNCCGHQVDKYIINGLLHKQIAPDEYMDKLMDYSEHNKTLNFISATYLPSVCQNVILEVGFGTGNLRRAHHGSVVEGAPYVMAGRELGDVGIRQIDSKIFDYHNITNELTFHWFKHDIMCRDHPWICKDGAGSSSEKGKKSGKGSGSKKSRRKNKSGKGKEPELRRRRLWSL